MEASDCPKDNLVRYLELDLDDHAKLFSRQYYHSVILR